VLTARQREIAIPTVAEAEQCSYEWNAHAGVARRAGLTDLQLDALRTGIWPGTAPPEEYLTWKIVRVLAREGDLADEDYAEATGVLGEAALFTLVSLVGHYRHSALAIRVWRVPLREGGTVPSARVLRRGPRDNVGRSSVVVRKSGRLRRAPTTLGTRDRLPVRRRRADGCGPEVAPGRARISK
jgi:hypothetical protein